MESKETEQSKSAFRPGSIILGKYRIEKLIGEGGMGSVFEVTDLNLDKRMALKVLTSQAKTPQSAVRFQNEARNASRAKHYAIAQTNDFGVTEDGSAYMAVELVEGESLTRYVQLHGGLRLKEFFSVFTDLCGALEAAHKAAIVHRDLKPENIMVFLDEQKILRSKLLDFGISRRIDVSEEDEAHRLTRAGQVIGTPLFMSPEQANGQSIDYKSDYYSLGCVMYFSLAGRPPFRGDTAFDTLQMHIEMDPPALTASASGEKIPEQIVGLVQDLMSKKPDDRPAEGIEKILLAENDALRVNALPELFAQEPVVPEPPPASKPNSKRIKLTLAACSIASIAVLLACLNFKRSPTETFKFGIEPVVNSKAVVDGAKRKELATQLEAHNSIIDLRFINVNDDDLRIAANYKKAKKILLDNNLRVTDRGISHFSKNSGLQNLSLTDTGIQSLHFVQHFPELKFLNIANTSIEDDDLGAFSSGAVERLNLQNTKVTVAGIRQLKKFGFAESSVIVGVKLGITDKGFTPQEILALARENNLLIDRRPLNEIIATESKKYQDAGDMNKADEYLAIMCELIPKNKPGKIADVYFRRVTLLKNSPNPKKERFLLERAARLYLEDEKTANLGEPQMRKYTRVRLVDMLIKQKRFADAAVGEKELLRVCDMRTSDDRSFIYEMEKRFGNAYQSQKEYGSALRCYEIARKALQFSITAPLINAYISCFEAHCLYHLGRQDEALVKYQAVIDTIPKFGNYKMATQSRIDIDRALAHAYVGLTQILIEKGDFKRAKKLYDTGYKFNDTFVRDKDCYDQLAGQKRILHSHH